MTSPAPTPLTSWTPRLLPPPTPMQGRLVRLERLDPSRHGEDLEGIFLTAPEATWNYLPYGPYPDEASYRSWLSEVAPKPDPMFHAIIDARTGKPCGVASLMRIDQANGVIEVGHIHFGPDLKRSPAATEAIYLFMVRVFEELGYRRFEWKCNAANAASRRAAERFGFTYEGTFRQAAVVKGKNRDTAWFSLLDREWPQTKAAFEAWLAPENFDSSGQQISRLSCSTQNQLID